MKGFLDNFYNIDVLGGTLVSDQAFQASWSIAAAASATAAVACIGTWETDFRDDLPKIDVTVLTVQGDADRILPYPNTGKRLPGLINDIQLVVIERGPHAIVWTHADQVNRALRSASWINPRTPYPKGTHDVRQTRLVARRNAPDHHRRGPGPRGAARHRGPGRLRPRCYRRHRAFRRRHRHWLGQARQPAHAHITEINAPTCQ